MRLAEAMLRDVLDAATQVGRVFVVAPAAPSLPRGVTHVADPRRGQGAAVEDALDAALAAGASAPLVVVNADVPCVTPRDLLTLIGSMPERGLAVAPAADGTTNAIAFAERELFAPVYGPGSAARFAALGESRTVDLENLADDVDTIADLERVADRLGAATRTVLAQLRLGRAA